MIIKLLKQSVVDGKLREKGEIIRVGTFDGEHNVLKTTEQEVKEQEKNKNYIKKFKKYKIKKNGKTK